MKSAIEFLLKIYTKQCEENDYIILSAKGDSWRDVPLKFDANFKSNLRKFFQDYPMSEYDLYWSPIPYSRPQRRIVNTLDTKFLVQDIDEIDPSDIKPKPSYLWESSDNKYQGMWELDRYIDEKEYTPLNRTFAKYLGCDDCFDIVHVYRIPGTINHKYKDKPKVKLPVESSKIYKPRNIKKLIDYQEEKKEKAPTPSNLSERKIYAKYNIPKKVKDLLALDDLSGLDRSSTIWFIENKLYELGMTPNEIIHLVKNSVFNKYKGRADEKKRLKAELDKIISGGLDEEKESKSFKVAGYEEVMSNQNTFEGWLVKGFWGRRSHGIVAGMPKCFKSTLVHDLMISVASGKKFLNKYPVLEPGPVLVIQNENADYMMKDRTEKMIADKGLGGKIRYRRENPNLVNVRFPKNLPIHFINQQGFVINESSHRDQLEHLIKKHKPVLVILDPLYLMFEGDLNSAKDLNPVLNWLLYLKNEYKTSVMVIHHYNKSKDGPKSGGARMMGSVILYGWVESAWYLSKGENEDLEVPEGAETDQAREEPAEITLSREFRMSGHHPDLDLYVTMGDIGECKYNVDVQLSGHRRVQAAMPDLIIEELRGKDFMTKEQLEKSLNKPWLAIKDGIRILENSGKIKQTKKGYKAEGGKL